MYNSANYNEPNYNSTHFSVEAFEALSSADQKLMAMSALKADIAILTDAISKVMNNDSFLDAVLSTDDDVANVIGKFLSDTATLSDIQKVSLSKALAEVLTLADLRSMVYELRRVDALTLSDNLTKSITEKIFMESIRLQSWLSVKKTGSQWSD